MSVSTRGVWLAARPLLGKAKRRAQRTVRSSNLSGRPAIQRASGDRVAAGHAEFIAGLAVLRLGRRDTAIEMMERANALDPRFVRRWSRLGAMYLDDGRHRQAAAAFEKALALYPTHRESLLNLGTLRILEDQGIENDLRRTSSKELVERALAHIRPHELPGHLKFWYGVTREQAGDTDAAREFYSEAIGEVAHPDHMLQLARMEATLGNWDSATDSYVRMLESAFPDDNRLLAGVTPDQVVTELSDGRRLFGGPRDDWGKVAIISAARLKDEPGDLRLMSELAESLIHLKDWPAAAQSFKALADARPTDVKTWERLAAVHARLGNFEQAADARRRALILDPTASRYHRLALELVAADENEAATDAFDHAIRLAGFRPKWIDRMGAARRNSAQWAEVAMMYRTAADRMPDEGKYWYQLGYALEQLDDLDEAAHAYARAVAAEPTNAAWIFRLGYLHERHGPEQTVHRSRTGLERASSGDLEQAIGCYRRVLELEPHDVRTLLRLGGVEERLGRHDEAEGAYRKAAELDPTNDDAWHLVGRAIVARANSRGIYHSDEHDELESVWGRSIALKPNRSGSRQQLVRASIKAGRWRLASQMAWYPPPLILATDARDPLRTYLESDVGDSVVDSVAEVLGQADSSLMTVPMEWWFPLHWRLLTDNEFTLAYRAKELMALRIVADDTGGPDDNLAKFLEHTRALNFLGRQSEALELLTPSLAGSMSAPTRSALTKQAADIQLLLGDPGPYTDLLAMNSSSDTHAAEERLRQLVTGRNIAIVGPGMSEDLHGGEIDSHDTVVRTKFVGDQLDHHGEIAGSRTDISYYALGSAQVLRSGIADAIARGALQLAVFRTGTYRPEPAFLVRPGDVRYVPSEYTAGLRSGQFAIQRIIYDLLRYEPASIKIFNIDFFLSLDNYRPGYNANDRDEKAALGFLQVLGSFGHDFLKDFEFTRAMTTAGFVTADRRITELLELAPTDYLRALDRRR